MQIVGVLFVLLLAIFPLGQVGRVESGGGVNLLLNDFIVFLLVVVWGFSKVIKNKENLMSKPFAKQIFLFGGLAFISLSLNPLHLTFSELAVSSLYLFRWIAYALLFFIVSGFSDPFKRKIPYMLVGMGMVTALIGFVQYILYPNLRNLYYAGWDDHLYRLFSSFLDPNFAGGIFVLTFILAIWLLFEKTSHATSDVVRLIYFLALAFAFVASSVALLLTYSRGSFLSFLVGSFTYLWLLGRKKLAVLLFVVFALGIFLLPKNLKSEGVELLRTASINQRIEAAQNAITIFRDNPVFGVGFNAYRYVQIKYGFLSLEQAAVSHSAAGTDNSFIFVLATTGIIGLVAYLYLWGTIIKTYWGNPLIIASLVAICVHAFFVNSLFYPWIMEWLWILLGISKAQRSL